MTREELEEKLHFVWAGDDATGIQMHKSIMAEFDRLNGELQEARDLAERDIIRLTLERDECSAQLEFNKVAHACEIQDLEAHRAAWIESSERDKRLLEQNAIAIARRDAALVLIAKGYHSTLPTDVDGILRHFDCNGP